MSFNSIVKARVAEHLTSEARLENTRKRVEKKRLRRNEAHIVHYFHHVADPYCHLTASMLAAFCDRYEVDLVPHLISGPPSWATPNRGALEKFAYDDTARLAKKLDLPPLASRETVEPNLKTAQALVSAMLGSANFSTELAELSAALWSGADLPKAPKPADGKAISRADAELASLGHYLGATFYYGGEWYWGIDRLQYLETRLQELGLGRRQSPLVPPPQIIADTRAIPGQEVDFYFSFRSPYSYLVFDRAVALAEQLGVRLNLRPVLPMVMRGLAVPRTKRRYILHDAAREARRLEIPFGRICDPLGTAVERGYSLLSYAESEGRLGEYCAQFMAGVWSKGIDAATERGLAQILKNASLDWEIARQHLETDNWRERVEDNCLALERAGLWGVPSFKIAETAVWGQDRLWAMADELVRPGQSPVNK